MNDLNDNGKMSNAAPCPFCGGTDIVLEDVGGYDLCCLGCGFTTPAYMDPQQAISEYQRVANKVAEGTSK